MNTRFNIFLVLIFLLIPFTRTANADVKILLFGGFYLGGDTLVDSNDDFDLDAGNGLHVGMGFLFLPENSPLALQLTLGYKFGFTEFEDPDGDASTRSFPLEVMVYYKMNKLRVGGGVAYHMNPKFEFCPDDTKCNRTDFDDATGVMIEVAYDLAELVYIAARLTDMDYDADNIDTVDANNFGVNVGYKF